MVCDFLHATYEVDAKLERGSDKVFRVRWYFCAPGAKVLPILSSVTSPTWSTHATDREDFGIKSTSFRKYKIIERPPMALGKCYRGRPDQFVFGQLPTDPYAPFTACCPEALLPPPDQDGGGIDDMPVLVSLDLDGGGVRDIPYAGGGDLDGGYLRDSVSVYALEYDGGYVFDHNQAGGGDLDSAEESGYFARIVVCTPSFAPGMLVALFTDPNVPPTFPPAALMNLGLVTPTKWGLITGDPSFPWTVELECSAPGAVWVLTAVHTIFGVVSFVFTGSGPPFLLTGFSLTSPLFGPSPVLVTIRQPTTFVRVPVDGGDLDSLTGPDVPVSPKLELDGSQLTRHDFLFAGELDGSQLTRHDFLFAGELDGSGPDVAESTRGGDLDGMEMRRVDALYCGELDGGHVYELPPYIVSACSPALVPVALWVDVVNPNVGGLPTGTYPLALNDPFPDVWTFGLPGSDPDWEILFFCSSPSNTWRLVTGNGSFTIGGNLPAGTTPPFRVGPFVFSVAWMGPSPVSFTVHE